MKQIYFQNTAQNQNPKGIVDASSGKGNSISKSKPSGINAPNHPSHGWLLSLGMSSVECLSKQVSGGGSNIFLNQNKGKGPPGRQLSPGVASFPEHPPDVQTNPVRVQKSDTIEEQLNQHINTNRIFSQRPLSLSKGHSVSLSEGWSLSSSKGWFLSLPKENTIHTEQKNYTYTKFYLQLNFTIMKKQILFLMVALFASVTVAWGQQAGHNSNPIPLVCPNDALHPIAGKAYSYTVAPTPDPIGNYTWWATKDINFITASGTTTNMMTTYLKSPSTVTPGTDLTFTSANYLSPTLNASSVSITWSSSILNGTGYQNSNSKTSTFVAVHFQPTSNCADNFKVFELDPKNGFTVDITNVNHSTLASLGYTVSETQCFDKVSKATYVAPNMSYEYGTNILYFEVIAANFSEEWKPQFTLTGLQAGQTADIVWDYTTAFSSPKTVTSGALSATAATTTATDTSTGVSIYVRVTITNGYFEGLIDTPITLAVDGQNKEGLWDVRNDDCAQPSPLIADLYDVATQTLLKRPTVLANPDPFSPIPTNQRIIPKNP